MAGPNMVENENDNKTAFAVKKAGAQFLRGGALSHYLFRIEVKNILKQESRV